MLPQFREIRKNIFILICIYKLDKRFQSESFKFPKNGDYSDYNKINKNNLYPNIHYKPMFHLRIIIYNNLHNYDKNSGNAEIFIKKYYSTL